MLAVGDKGALTAGADGARETAGVVRTLIGAEAENGIISSGPERLRDHGVCEPRPRVDEGCSDPQPAFIAVVVGGGATRLTEGCAGGRVARGAEVVERRLELKVAWARQQVQA